MGKSIVIITVVLLYLRAQWQQVWDAETNLKIIMSKQVRSGQMSKIWAVFISGPAKVCCGKTEAMKKQSLANFICDAKSESKQDVNHVTTLK